MRFPRFEGDKENVYRRYSFNDIFLFSSGKNIKQNQASTEFEIPCVRYGELYHMYGEVIYEVINKTNLDKSELLFSDGDEILLPSAGEDPLDIGSASALTIKDVAIGRTINILKPTKPNLYSQIYVAYYINQKLRKPISTLAKGVSISNVYNSDLKTLEIILPSINEQAKISAFLTLVDRRIQTQNKIINDLITLKTLLSKKILSQELKFKDIDENDYPEWNAIMLKDIATKKASNISANSLEENQGEFPIYGATGLLKTIDFYSEEEPYIAIVKDGAGVGRLFLYEGKTSVLGTLDIIKNSRRVDLKFLYYVLNTVDFSKYTTGSTIPHIYFKDYSNKAIDLPTLPEQQNIAKFLSSIDSKIETENQLLQKLKEQKRFLLDNIFV